MDDQLLTLSKIFTERLFRIPDYQRGYAWTEKQLKDFWLDISQLEAGRNHYTGVLTLESVQASTYRDWQDDSWIISAKSYQPFYVVDGQQRLTTAIILIQTILEKAEATDPKSKLNYTTIQDVQRKFIFDSKDDLISRSYIFGYEDKNPSYEFLKSRIFCERTSGEIQETVYTQNLERAKAFFADKISVFSHEELELLYRKVTQNLLFNLFSISEEVDVCVAFETMNNRGKPLSYLELLKNRLIYLSLKFDEPDYERNKLRRAINDCWRTLYHNLGRNKQQPLDDDRFLLTHFFVYFGQSGGDVLKRAERYYYRRGMIDVYNGSYPGYARTLLEEMFITKNISKDAPESSRVTLMKIYEYVSSLQDSIKVWYNIFNPFDSGYDDDTQIWLDKINRIRAETFFPIILIFLQKVKDSSKRVAFLQAVERHVFVATLGDMYFNPMASLSDPESYLKLAVDLATGHTTGDKVTRHITDETNGYIKHESFLKATSDSFKARGFYEWRLIRHFLFEYNLDLQQRSKTERAKINWPEFTEQKSDYVSVEHIYPQNARHEYWTTRFGKFTVKQRAILRNSLGNLLPLSKPKNSSLSNKPFDEKIDGRIDTSIGYRYGCYAENEVSKAKEWTADEILGRGLKMLSFMEKRWSIDLGSEGQKKVLLGLDFMKTSEDSEFN
ncbi:DUF262 domain-containing protein [Azospirillum palustre]